MTMMCDGYPKVQLTTDAFGKIQRAIGGLVDGLPEEFIPKPVNTY
jgi:hypothetical protein